MRSGDAVLERVGLTRESVMRMTGARPRPKFTLPPLREDSRQAYVRHRPLLEMLLEYAENEYECSDAGTFCFTRLVARAGADYSCAKEFMYLRFGSMKPEFDTIRRFIDATDELYGISA